MFPKKQVPTPRQPQRSTIDAMAGATFSVFGADTLVQGDVTASADLHIDGRIEGDIACAALVQGEGSEIAGAITAHSARLAGVLRGTITAGELVILKSARIHGDVFYDTLTIEQGAQVEGRFAQRQAEGAASGAKPGDGEPRLALAN